MRLLIPLQLLQLVHAAAERLLVVRQGWLWMHMWPLI
jgi:hypothetical protein